MNVKTTKIRILALAMMLFPLSSLEAAPAGIRLGPPPDPLGIRLAAAAALIDAEARKPGPPPAPLKEGLRG